jgi:tRNA (guanosine-2'-O-)-methyltransferase
MTVGDRRKEKIVSVVRSRQRGVAIVLEDIHDPHNVAAILRTCDAFGVQDVRLVYEKESFVNPKRVGKASSSSANKWLDFTVYRSSEECAKGLKKDGYLIYATMLAEDSMPIGEVDFTGEPIALVFGNEHRGVSNVMSQMSDVKVRIPMRGMVQSLNVSVTAAICLLELTRQSEASGKAFTLSAKEQKKLMKDFLER